MPALGQSRLLERWFSLIGSAWVMCTNDCSSSKFSEDVSWGRGGVGGGAGKPDQLMSPTGLSPWPTTFFSYTHSLQWSDCMVLNIVYVVMS